MSQAPDPHPTGSGTSPAIVAIPTYNERDNIETTVAAALAGCERIDILIVDDSSPDGTGDIADALAEAHERVHVLHRAEKQGPGAAYLAAFDWASEHGYRTVIVDGRRRLPRPRRPAPPPRRPRRRRGRRDRLPLHPRRRRPQLGAPPPALSRAAGVFTRAMLGLRVKDVTAATAPTASTASTSSSSTPSTRRLLLRIDLTWRAVKPDSTSAKSPSSSPNGAPAPPR